MSSRVVHVLIPPSTSPLRLIVASTADVCALRLAVSALTDAPSPSSISLFVQCGEAGGEEATSFVLADGVSHVEELEDAAPIPPAPYHTPLIATIIVAEEDGGVAGGEEEEWGGEWEGEWAPHAGGEGEECGSFSYRVPHHKVRLFHPPHPPRDVDDDEAPRAHHELVGVGDTAAELINLLSQRCYGDTPLSLYYQGALVTPDTPLSQLPYDAPLHVTLRSPSLLFFRLITPTPIHVPTSSSSSPVPVSSLTSHDVLTLYTNPDRDTIETIKERLWRTFGLHPSSTCLISPSGSRVDVHGKEQETCTALGMTHEMTLTMALTPFSLSVTDDAKHKMHELPVFPNETVAHVLHRCQVAWGQPPHEGGAQAPSLFFGGEELDPSRTLMSHFIPPSSHCRFVHGAPARIHRGSRRGRRHSVTESRVIATELADIASVAVVSAGEAAEEAAELEAEAAVSTPGAPTRSYLPLLTPSVEQRPKRDREGGDSGYEDGNGEGSGEGKKRRRRRRSSRHHKHETSVDAAATPQQVEPAMIKYTFGPLNTHMLFGDDGSPHVMHAPVQHALGSPKSSPLRNADALPIE